MGSYVIPGPLCGSQAEPIDSGTLNLQRSPTPGPIGVHCDTWKSRQIKPLTNGVFGLSYETTLLKQPLNVRIAGYSPEAVEEVSEKIDASLVLINQNHRRLSKKQQEAVQAVKEVLSDPTRHSGITSFERRQYNITPGYVMRCSKAWLAATIAHDGTHIIQRQRGDVYDPHSAARLEQEANDIMLSIGAILGLSPEEVKQIKKDRHTAYNVQFY